MENPNKQRIKFASGERVAELPIRKTPNGHRFAVTNYGRVISYTTIPEEGVVLKQCKIRKYNGVSVARKSYLVHRLVAKFFLRRYAPDQLHVIHLDYDNENNYYQNLKWVNREEMYDHIRKNPRPEKRGRQKLTEGRVRMIKQRLLNGKTRLKMLGKQFGVSDMTIHRIKTGENWGHVKI